jgi:hypothetical protein
MTDAIGQQGRKRKSAEFSMRQGTAFAALLIVAAFLGACTHNRSGDPRKHFAEFSVAPPDGDAVKSATPIPVR